MDKTRIVLIIIPLVLILTILSGCAAQGNSVTEKRIVSAKIRCFDDSTETVAVNGYSFGYNSMVVLYTADGRKIVVGPNNVIFVEEYERQHDGK